MDSGLKVLLVANYQPDEQTSMLAFHRLLERELPALGCQVRVVAPRKRVGGWLPATSRWWKWLGYIDKFVLFLPTLRRQARWADVVHVCDHSNGMYVPWVRNIKPTVITCHDVIAIQAALGMIEGWNVGLTGRVFQRLIGRGLGQADRVVCASELTRNDLLALGLADERAAFTILLGLHDDFARPSDEEAARLLTRFNLSASDDYLLHVGSDLPRKNRRAVIETYIALQQRAAASGTAPLVRQLVFVGPELAPEMAELAHANGVADQIRILRGVSHDELCAIYASATALLFPSLNEGFGWPPIEGQACGCPVFTSDLPPMNEVGGEAAVYIDPRKPLAIAEAIEAAAPRFAQMREIGLANAPSHASGEMASRYIPVYHRVIAERKDRP